MSEARLNGTKRFLERDLDQTQLREIAGGTAAVYTIRAPDKDTANEDAVALIPCGERAGVLVVADGMGGLPAGAQASGQAVRALDRALRQAQRGDIPLREAILNGIENANRAVSDMGIGAGTTLAVVEIQNDIARSYHVGDSKIVVCGQRGKLKHQTVSHSPVGYAVEAGFLDAGEAMHHEERHLISNIIGTPDMRIEIGTAIRLTQHDTVILASDGLFDNLHVEEIVERVRKGPLTIAADRLRGDCRKRMLNAESGHPSKPDDLSFIVFRLGQLH